MPQKILESGYCEWASEQVFQSLGLTLEKNLYFTMPGSYQKVIGGCFWLGPSWTIFSHPNQIKLWDSITWLYRILNTQF